MCSGLLVMRNTWTDTPYVTVCEGSERIDPADRCSYLLRTPLHRVADSHSVFYFSTI
jgi:hypothetical protein